MGSAAALLREALKRSGMTARALALRTGVGEGRMSDYLSGRHVPGSDRLLAMVAATGQRLCLEAVPNFDRNGLVLPELLDLADAVAVDRGRPRREDRLPLFGELVAGRG